MHKIIPGCYGMFGQYSMTPPHTTSITHIINVNHSPNVCVTRSKHGALSIAIEQVFALHVRDKRCQTLTQYAICY